MAKSLLLKGARKILSPKPRPKKSRHKEEFSDEDIAVAEKTARSAGAVGQQPSVVTKAAMNLLTDKQKMEPVMDYGAGKGMRQTAILREEGFSNVVAYDFNLNPGALSEKYGTVLASNVLNVQNSPRSLNLTIAQLLGSVKKKGLVLANFPTSPLKGAYKGMSYGQAKQFLSVALSKGGFNIREIQEKGKPALFSLTPKNVRKAK